MLPAQDGLKRVQRLISKWNVNWSLFRYEFLKFDKKVKFDIKAFSLLYYAFYSNSYLCKNKNGLTLPYEVVNFFSRYIIFKFEGVKEYI